MFSHLAMAGMANAEYAAAMARHRTQPDILRVQFDSVT